MFSNTGWPPLGKCQELVRQALGAERGLFSHGQDFLEFRVQTGPYFHGVER